MTAPAASRDLREGGVWTRGQRLKNDLLHAAIVAALAVVTRLPRRALALGCRALAAFAHLVRPRERALVRTRLAAGLGAPVSSARVRAVFRRAADVLSDTLALLDPREPAARTLTVDPESRATFQAALDRGRGVVFVSAHLGPWERLAAVLAEGGFPVATVARESYDPRLTRLYDRLRAPRGVRSIYRGGAGAAAAILRELRAGRAVGFLVDLPARVPSTPCHLFGVDVDLPVGAARIALARRAAVVVGTWAPGDRVHITPIDCADLTRGAEGERALVGRITREVEARIRADPDAWLGLFTPTRR